MQIFKVGGAVRDRLLDLAVKDVDRVVVGATPQDMLDAGFRQVGRDFPVFLHPRTSEEYALARTERKSGHGYTGFTVHAAPDVTLEEDLQRRDLTINAIAEAEDGSLIDPFGGQRDIAARLLRHVSPAFAEDPLRVLRVARFAARFAPLGFRVADETRELMRAITAAGELGHLVAERVWQETCRALHEQQPAVFFEVLRDCGALAALFPELARLFTAAVESTRHSEGQLALAALEQSVQLGGGGKVRFAALCHNLDDGQGPAPQAALDALRERLKIPNDYYDLASLVLRLRTGCDSTLESDPEQKLTLLEACDAFRKENRFDDFLLACEAVWIARHQPGQTTFPQRSVMQAALAAAREVSTQAIVADGFKGREIGVELRRRRLARLGTIRERDPT